MRNKPFILGAMLALAFAASPASAAVTKYAFGAGTTVSYTLVHPAHTVHGVSSSLAGDLKVENGKPVLPATFTVAWRSFNSGNANRDANALTAVGAARFPTATLTLTSYKVISERAEGPVLAISGEAQGSIKVRGVAKPVTVAVSGKVGPDSVNFDASFPLSLAAHGIPAPKLVFVPTEDAVKVEVHGVAKRM